jgi:hypothetical protein
MLQPLDPRIVQRFPFPLEANPTGPNDAWLIGAGYIGSMSHNTHVPSTDPNSIDDTDIQGIVLPPQKYLVGLSEWDNWRLQEAELDVIFYSFHKMVRLLLKANPNVLGFLWLRPEHYIWRSPILDTFIAQRDLFSSQHAARSFMGYAEGQFRKMTSGAFQGYMGEKRKKLVEQHGFDTKMAAHTIRLLHMGTEFLRTGKLNVYRTWDAPFLRDIKAGKLSLEEVRDHIAAAIEYFRTMEPRSILPAEPDRASIEDLVMAVTKEHLAR